MASHNETGIKGEAIAEEYLLKKGYSILETNWRFKRDELDIIAQKNNTLIIAEVKTRSSNYFEQPEEAVNKNKQQRIIRATNGFLEQQNLHLEVRFDVITILIGKNNQRLNHIKDAFSILG